MNSDRVSYIYCLIDTDGRPKYIGQTSRPLDGCKGRASVHYRHRFLDDDRRNPRLNAWLRTLDRAPETVVLEVVPYEQRFKVEAAWTRCFRWALGDQIFNINTGAEVSPEVTARISATKRRLNAQRKQLATAA
ncbi:hypothetical protein [Streptomyces sp. enrichment culture]|uniref:hypothetical protein n=1 Tax=Streptomyces sp. enrichment culture TaxID=1795815 RepID=UPI003F54B2E8